ncbi:MAG: ORF6N domain-containing protein [Campylobacterales bacterium]|nr:ORF6N domain-containing protein [Campylobacterales bacterium]
MNNIITDNHTIQNKIFTVRDVQVMLDADLAELYGVETKQLNKAVSRNLDRFPESFRFQLTQHEFDNLRFQNGTSSEHGGRRYLPFVFTEQGVSMLSAVLRSTTAVQVSIRIIETFVVMRRFITQNAGIFERFERIEQRLSIHDENFNKIFDAIEDKTIKPKQGIFYNGQIFDAYIFVNDLIKSAKNTITLFDNYIDESVLTLLSKNQTVKITIYTKNISKQLKLDVEKYNSQYKQIELKKFDLSHDRFLLVDDEVYHIGTSLKDLGKKWFAFSKMDKASFEIMERLK